MTSTTAGNQSQERYDKSDSHNDYGSYRRGQGQRAKARRKGQNEDDQGGYESNGSSQDQGMSKYATAAAGAGLVLWGMKRGGLTGLALSSLGGTLLWRGAQECDLMNTVLEKTGLSDIADQIKGDGGGRVTSGVIHSRCTMLINRPAEELYDIWRDTQGLTRFFSHVDEIEDTHDNRSRWTATVLKAGQVTWESQIDQEHRPHHFSWHSMDGSVIDTHGSISFNQRAGSDATEVTLESHTHLPGGKIGHITAKAIGADPAWEVKDALHNLKEFAEGQGQEGQDRAQGSGKSGRSSGQAGKKKVDPVTEAGKESFPASDPPSFNP